MSAISMRRPGATLVELLVVLAILGVLAGVGGLAMRLPAPPAPDDPARALAALRRDALRSGIARTVVLRVHGIARVVTALPDGRVIADGDSLVALATGRLADATR